MSVMVRLEMTSQVLRASVHGLISVSYKVLKVLQVPQVLRARQVQLVLRVFPQLMVVSS